MTPTTKKTQQLVDGYYESWIGTKSINTTALEDILAPELKYNGPIDTNHSRAEFLPGLAEFAQINGGVTFETRHYGETEAFAIYNAHVVPLGEDLRIFERFAIDGDRISQIDLVFDSIKLRPLIAAARAGATVSEPRRVVVRYRVKADKVEENATAIKTVFSQLDDSRPDGLNYMSLRGADGTFVHVATIEGANPLAELEAFKAFQSGLKERCEELPAALDVQLVGKYPS